MIAPDECARKRQWHDHAAISVAQSAAAAPAQAAEAATN